MSQCLKEINKLIGNKLYEEWETIEYANKAG
jgi:hypothetical protein